MQETEFYSILGVAQTATEEEIRKAYRLRVQEWHPDKHPDNQVEAARMFKEINLAYEMLSDSQSRKLYDLTLGAEIELKEQILTPEPAPSAPVAAQRDDTQESDQVASTHQEAAANEPASAATETTQDQGEQETTESPASDAPAEEIDDEIDEDTVEEDPVWSPYEQSKASTDDAAAWQGCTLCASIPAEELTLREDFAWIFWRTQQVVDGAFCRDCGLSLYRRMTNRSLLLGWWGPLPLFTNLATLWSNFRSLQTIQNLAPPVQPPGVNRHNVRPLYPGRSLFLRSGMILMVAMVLLTAGLFNRVMSSKNVQGASGIRTAKVDIDRVTASDVVSSTGADVVVASDEGVASDGGNANLKILSSRVLRLKEDAGASPDTPDVVQRPINEEDQAVEIPPAIELDLFNDTVLVASFSSVRVLGAVESRAGIPNLERELGLPDRTDLSAWTALGASLDRPFFVVVWTSPQGHHISTVLPVGDRVALEEHRGRLLEDTGGKKDFMVHRSGSKPVYVHDLDGYISVSVEPQKYLDRAGMVPSLSERLRKFSGVQLSMNVDPFTRDDLSSVLRRVALTREHFEFVNVPIDGLVVMAYAAYWGLPKVEHWDDRVEKIELQLDQRDSGLRLSAKAVMVDAHPFIETLLSSKSSGPESLTSVPKDSYFVFSWNKTLAKVIDFAPELSMPLQDFFGIHEDDVDIMAPRVRAWAGSLRDTTISLSHIAEREHDLRLVGSLPKGGVNFTGQKAAQAFFTEVKSQVRDLLAPREMFNTTNWMDLFVVLREATRGGPLRVDPINDKPVLGMRVMPDDGRHAKGAAPTLKLFKAITGETLRFAAGTHGHLTTVTVGREAVSNAWLSLRADRVRHVPSLDLLSAGPRNPQMVFWLDADKALDALLPVEGALCAMIPAKAPLKEEVVDGADVKPAEVAAQDPGADASLIVEEEVKEEPAPPPCPSLAQRDLAGQYGLTIGSDRDSVSLIVDVPFGGIQRLSALWAMTDVPRQFDLTAARALAHEVLKGPYAFGAKPRRRARKARSLKIDGVDGACGLLAQSICRRCGMRSPACRRYEQLAQKTSDSVCSVRLATFNKLQSLSTTDAFCSTASAALTNLGFYRPR